MRPAAFVLDLDDTLYDTTGRLVPWADRRAAAVLVAAGAASSEDDVLAEIARLRAAGCVTIFGEIARAAGVAATVADAAEAAWLDYDPPPMELDDDVSRALDRLAAAAPLALLTSGHPATQRRKIERLGISGRFAECRIADFRAPGGKIAALADLLRTHGWDAARTVVVGDRPDGDVRAANRNGCIAVLVRREGGEFANVRPESHDDVPWRVVSSVSEVPSLFGLSTGDGPA